MNALYMLINSSITQQTPHISEKAAITQHYIA